MIRFNIIILLNSAESHLISILTKILYNLISVGAMYLHTDVDPSGCEVEDVGMLSLDYWAWRFESRQWHECLYLLSVVGFQVEVSALGLSPVQRSPTDCGVSE